MNKSDILWIISGIAMLALYFYGLYLTRKPKHTKTPSHFGMAFDSKPKGMS